MKGPFERLKYDLRRLWECPVCQHRERTDCTVVLRICQCQRQEDPTRQLAMKLIKDGVQRIDGR